MKIRNIEFSTSIEEDPSDLTFCVALFGMEGSGKTHFIATCPDPIGVIALDRKTRFTIKKVARDLGKQVFMPKKDFIRVERPLDLATMKEEKVKTYYMNHVKEVMEAAYALCEHKDVRTVAIDTGTQLWEDIMFAEFGRNQRVMPRDRGAVNQMMIDFLNAMQAKHLVLTHKAADVWKNDASTGEKKAAGFAHINYHATVVAEMVKNPKYRVEGHKSPKVPDWQFAMNVKTCQANALLQGEDGQALLTEPSDDEDYEISFKNLARLVFPEVDEEEWD